MKTLIAIVFAALVATAGAVTVNLAWDPSSSGNVVGYRIRVVDANGTAIRSLDVGLALTGSFTDLVAGAKYLFNVVAYNGSGESVPTNTVEWSAPTSADGGSASPPVLRINCGGPEYTDSAGQVWSADTAFLDGRTKTYPNWVSGTRDQVLFRSERYGATLSYDIAVPNGNYDVTLSFAEMYWSGAGQRVFNVALEGKTVLSNLDIYALVGRYAALERTSRVAVGDGRLNIRGTASVDSAKFSALLVRPALTPTPTPSPSATAIPSPSPSPILSALTVVAAPSGAVIGPFVSGYAYDLKQSLSVRADAKSGVASVVFKLDGTTIRTESLLPYTVAGDDKGIFTAWRPSIGNHYLVVTPYSAAGGGGIAGNPITVNFTVTNSAP